VSVRNSSRGPSLHRGRRSSPREHLDKAALVGAFLVGVAGTLALKLMGVPPLWSAGWTAAVLVFYALVALALGQLRIEPESVGDNCYYLGFLFTLTSLSVTLFQLAQDTGQTGALREVVGGFGIALSSTIVGVFLRVVLMQIRPDIVARDREARLELSRAGRDFRAELGASVALIKDFTVEATQLAAEQGKKIGDMTSELAEVQRARMAEDAALQAATLRKALETAGQDVSKSLAASIKAASKTTETEVRASLASLAAAVEAFSRAEIAALEARRQRDAATAETAGQALARAAGLVAQTEGLAARLGAALEAISSELKDGVSALADARAELAREEARRVPVDVLAAVAPGDDRRDPRRENGHDDAPDPAHGERDPSALPDRPLGGLLSGFGIIRR
jgi:hypothetical protein